MIFVFFRLHEARLDCDNGGCDLSSCPLKPISPYKTSLEIQNLQAYLLLQFRQDTHEVVGSQGKSKIGAGRSFDDEKAMLGV